MVYENKIVAVIKSDGKILRERDGIITLSYGTEYSILLKNLNSRKVSIDIDIDGKDILNGKSLLIPSNSETELEGFLEGNVAKNKFKFIQKTKQIQEHRGDNIDDGIIRIEFAFEEKVTQLWPTLYKRYWYPKYYNSFNLMNDRACDHNPNNVIYGASSFSCAENNIKGSSNVAYDNLSKPNVDEGITVKGSEVNQNFHNGYVGNLESSQVIILKLRGVKQSGKFVKQTITTRTKFTCSTCGKRSKSSAKFCDSCGTFLE